MTGTSIGTDVVVSRRGDIVDVVLSNPQARNAQTPATWRGLAAIPEQVESDARFIVLSAEGPSFSAGLDRRMLSPEGGSGGAQRAEHDDQQGIGEESLWQLATREDAAIDAMITDAQRAFSWWRESPAITIALVQGHAIGAGFQLALACDLMIVAPDALLAMRETSLGLVPDLGGTGALVERVGYSRALEICATGRYVDAEEAVRLGIATALAPRDDWDSAVERLITPIREALPDAVTELKHLLQGAAVGDEQLARERAAQTRRLRALAALVRGQG